MFSKFYHGKLEFVSVMWQQQFVDIAFKLTEHAINQKTVILESKALSTITIDCQKT